MARLSSHNLIVYHLSRQAPPRPIEIPSESCRCLSAIHFVVQNSSPPPRASSLLCGSSSISPPPLQFPLFSHHTHPSQCLDRPCVNLPALSGLSLRAESLLYVTSPLDFHPTKSLRPSTSTSSALSNHPHQLKSLTPICPIILPIFNY